MFGGFLGDPRRRAADLFLSLNNVLPNSYPLATANIETVLAEENYFARIIDYGIIAPRIAADLPFTPPTTSTSRGSLELSTDQYPVYAWPYEHRLGLADRPLPNGDRPRPGTRRTATGPTNGHAVSGFLERLDAAARRRRLRDCRRSGLR